MIPVNQGIQISIPQKVKKRRAHDISYQGGTFAWAREGEKHLRGSGTVEVGHHVLNIYIYIYIYI